MDNLNDLFADKPSLCKSPTGSKLIIRTTTTYNLKNLFTDEPLYTGTTDTKFITKNNTVLFIKINGDIDDCYPFVRFCYIWDFRQNNEFNRPIVLSKIIKCLTLSYRFDQLFVLTKHLNIIRFCTAHVCSALSKNLITIQFGVYYNQHTKPTKKLIMLYCGSSFNQPIKLSKNIKNINMGKHFNHQLFLPKRLTHFTASSMFAHQIILPSTLKYLSIGPKINAQKNISIQYFIKNITITCVLNSSNKYFIIDDLPNSTTCCNIKCYFYDYNGHIGTNKNDVAFLKKNLPTKTTFVCK